MRGITLAAALSSLLVFATPRALCADDAPAPYSWKRLAVRRLTLRDAQDRAAIREAFRDPQRMLKAFQPRGVQVEAIHVEPPAHGRSRQRLVFRAHAVVPVPLGPIRVRAPFDAWVRADAVSWEGRCPYDATRPAFGLKLLLSESDEPISANAHAIAVVACVDEGAAARPEVEVTTLMQVGPDYGARVAGAFVSRLLVDQTDPLVLAMLSAGGVPAETAMR